MSPLFPRSFDNYSNRFYNGAMPPGARRVLDGPLMREALRRLDGHLDAPLRLVIGGGGAMILAYGIPLHTQDVDAFPVQPGQLASIQEKARLVAAELDIEPDWLNSHFETFTFALPSDYASRLREVYRGSWLRADALGPEDLLVMKCMAGRDKDRPHARKLMREARDLDVVDRRLSELAEKGIAKASQACDFFDDLKEEMAQ